MPNKKIYYDTDFLGNKIDIGDKVIFEALKYRHFTFGKVVTKAEKSCQIEYVDDWGYKEICRQGYGQILKYLDVEKIKSEAYEEIAEKLIKELEDNTDNNGDINACYVPIIVDRVLKEIKGENNESN
jgi:hypothetical protein